MIIYTISQDLKQPRTPERIQVKQGEIYSRGLQLQLFSDGEPWTLPGDLAPLIRWFACNPDTGESTRGIYDTLPDGSHAMQWSGNQLDLVLTPQMFAMPGLVQADVVLQYEDRILSTFNFEFYVNPTPVDGTEPEAQSYYNVFTLSQINEAISDLQSLISQVDLRLCTVEQKLGIK